MHMLEESQTGCPLRARKEEVKGVDYFRASTDDQVRYLLGQSSSPDMLNYHRLGEVDYDGPFQRHFFLRRGNNPLSDSILVR